MLVFCENIYYICKTYAKRMAQIRVGPSVFYCLFTGEKKNMSSVSSTRNHNFSKSKKPCEQNILLCVINSILIPRISDMSYDLLQTVCITPSSKCTTTLVLNYCLPLEKNH